MVYMAAGKPDEKSIRKTADGETQIWSYVRYYSHYEPGYWGGDYLGWYDYPTSRIGGYGFGGYSRQTEYEYLRVEFREGKVVSVERKEPVGEMPEQFFKEADAE